MIFWYRTVEARLLESHPTDFDVRALPSDLVEKFHLERMRTPRSVHRLAIIEAIDRKIVTREGGPRKAYVSDVPALSSASDDEDLFW
ncbi:MAG: hypothetical protein HIU82_02225 [Proteobacteria bacterium]|nr:hypothetical protein [Pseudomonadota bacterium]